MAFLGRDVSVSTTTLSGRCNRHGLGEHIDLPDALADRRSYPHRSAARTRRWVTRPVSQFGDADSGTHVRYAVIPPTAEQIAE